MGIKSFFQRNTQRVKNAAGAPSRAVGKAKEDFARSGREDARRYQIQDTLIESGAKADTLERELSSRLGQVDRLVADLDRDLINLYDEGDRVVSRIQELHLDPQEQTAAGLDNLIMAWARFKTSTEHEAQTAHGGMDQLRQAIVAKEKAERRRRRLVPGTSLKFRADAFAGQVTANEQVTIESIENQVVSPAGAPVVRDRVVKLKKSDGTIITGIPFNLLNQMIEHGQTELGLDVNLARAAAIDSGVLINLLKSGGRQVEQQQALLELLRDQNPDRFNQLLDELLSNFEISEAVKAEVKKDVVAKVQAEMDSKVQQLVQKKSFWSTIKERGTWPAIGAIAVASGALLGGIGLGASVAIVSLAKMGKAYRQWSRRNKGGTPQEQLEDFESQALAALAKTGTIVDLTELGAMIANSVRTEGGRQIKELELKFSADPNLDDEKTVGELLPEYLASATEYLKAQGIEGEQLKTMARAVALSQLRAEQRAHLTAQDLERVRSKGALTRFGNWAHSQYSRVYGASPELERYIESRGTSKDALVLSGSYAVVGGALGYGMRSLSCHIPGLRSVMGAMGGLGLGKLINEYGDSVRRKDFLKKMKAEFDRIGAHLTNYERNYSKQGITPKDLTILDETRLSLLDYQGLSQIPELKITPGLQQQIENHLQRIEALKAKAWQEKKEAIDISIDKMMPAQLTETSRRQLKTTLLRYQGQELSAIPTTLPVPGSISQASEWTLQRNGVTDEFILYKNDFSGGTVTEITRYRYDDKKRWQSSDRKIRAERVSLEDQAESILENLRSHRELVAGMEIEVTLINSQARAIDLDPGAPAPLLVAAGQTLRVEYVDSSSVEVSYIDSQGRANQLTVSREIFEAELEMGNLTQRMTTQRQELLKRMDTQTMADHTRRIGVLAGMATVGAISFSSFGISKAKEFYTRPAASEAAVAAAAVPEPGMAPEDAPEVVPAPERVAIGQIEFNSEYGPEEQAYLSRAVAMVDARLQEAPSPELVNFRDQLLMEIRHGQAEQLLEATAGKDLDLAHPEQIAADLDSAEYFKASAAETVPLPTSSHSPEPGDAPAAPDVVPPETDFNYDYAAGSDGSSWRVHQEGETFVLEQRTPGGGYEAVRADTMFGGKMQIIKDPSGQVHNIIKIGEDGQVEKIGVLNRAGRIIYENPTEPPVDPAGHSAARGALIDETRRSRMPGEHRYSDAYPRDVLEARAAMRHSMLPLEPHEATVVSAPGTGGDPVGEVPIVNRQVAVDGDFKVVTITYESGLVVEKVLHDGAVIATSETLPQAVELVPRQIPEFGVVQVPEGAQGYVISGPGPATEDHTQYFRTTKAGFEVFDQDQQQWVISEHEDLASAEDALHGRSGEIKNMIPIDTRGMYEEPVYTPEKVRDLYDHQQLNAELARSREWLLSSANPQEFMERLEARSDLLEYADNYKGFEYHNGGLHGVSQREVDEILRRFDQGVAAGRYSSNDLDIVKLEIAEQTDGALNVDDHQTHAEKKVERQEDKRIRQDLKAGKDAEIERLRAEEGLSKAEARQEFQAQVWREQHGFERHINVEELRLHLFREEVPIRDFYEDVRHLSTDRLAELSRYSHDQFIALMRSDNFTPQEVERLLQERSAILAAYNEQTINYHSGTVQALDQQGTAHAYRHFRPEPNHLQHGFDGAGSMHSTSLDINRAGSPTAISFHEAKPLVDIVEAQGPNSGQWHDLREALRSAGYYPRVLGQGADTAVRRMMQDKI